MPQAVTRESDQPHTDFSHFAVPFPYFVRRRRKFGKSIRGTFQRRISIVYVLILRKIRSRYTRPQSGFPPLAGMVAFPSPNITSTRQKYRKYTPIQTRQGYTKYKKTTSGRGIKSYQRFNHSLHTCTILLLIILFSLCTHLVHMNLWYPDKKQHVQETLLFLLYSLCFPGHCLQQ